MKKTGEMADGDRQQFSVELDHQALVGKIITKGGTRYQIIDVQNQFFYQQGNYQSLIYFQKINDTGELEGRMMTGSIPPYADTQEIIDVLKENGYILLDDAPTVAEQEHYHESILIKTMIQAGLRYVLVPINSLAIDIGGDGDKPIDSSKFSQRILEVTSMIDRIIQSFPPEHVPTGLLDILTQLKALFYQINHQSEMEAGSDDQQLISTTIQHQLNTFGQKIQAMMGIS